MGRSKLRNPEQPRLGKKYSGVAVSRSELEDGDEDDPFAPVEEDQEQDPFARSADSDEGSVSSGASNASENSGSAVDEDDHAEDVSNLMQGTPIAKVSDEEIEGTDQSHKGSNGDKGSDLGSQTDSDLDIDDVTDENTSDASSRSPASTPRNDSGALTGRKELRDLLKRETARVAAGLSSNDDAKQGQAVKQQQTTYDRLLDARIKLQKGLTASNSLNADSITDADDREVIAKAEAAALSLWSTIDSLRCTMLLTMPLSDTTRKRKRPLAPNPSTPMSDLWEHSQSLETLSVPLRRNILNHWSTRTRASAPSQPRSNTQDKTREPPLSDVLDEYLRKETQKLGTSSTRSDAIPKHDQSQDQPSDGPNSAPSTPFQDTAFYQSLLRDLIASRTNNPLTSNTTTSLPSNNSITPGKPPPINNQKNRRGVDTKASKGRKIRYTVHEKLVSFLAPEDRSTWTEQARREFFGSLFGGQVGVSREEVVDNEGDLGMDGVGGGGREEGALKLFRS